MFIHWDWVRRFTGKDSDWNFCHSTICPHHQYSEEEKTFLLENELCVNSEKLNNAKPVTHHVCRIFCHQHGQQKGSCKTILRSPSHYHLHFIRQHGGSDKAIHHLFYKAAWTYHRLHFSPSKAIGSRTHPTVAAKPSMVTYEALKDMEVDNS